MRRFVGSLIACVCICSSAQSEELKLASKMGTVHISDDGMWLLTGALRIKSDVPDPGNIFGSHRMVKEGPIALGRVWDLRTGRQRAVFIEESPKNVIDMAISADGKFVAMSGYDEEFRFTFDGAGTAAAPVTSLWAVEGGEKLHTWKARGHLAFFPDGKRLIIAGEGGLHLADLTTYELKTDGINCGREVVPVVTDDGKEFFFAAGFKDGQWSVCAADAATGKPTRRYALANATNDTEIAVCAALSPNGKYLATGQSDYGNEDSTEACIMIWDRFKETEIRRFSGVAPYKVAFTPDNREVIGISTGGLVRNWSIETGEITRSIQLKSRSPTETDSENWSFYSGVADFSPDASFIAAINRESEEHFADLISLGDGRELARFYHLPEAKEWWTQSGDAFVKSDTWPAGPGSALTLPVLGGRREQVRASDGLPTGTEDSARVAQALFAVVKSAKIEAAPRPSETGGARLFFLGVGVSEYRFSEYNLRFAGRDIAGISQIFRTQEKQNYRDVIVQELRDAKATQPAILTELDTLARVCTGEDTAIVCLSGHGVRGRSGLFFVPHEGDLESISTCLNWSHVAERLSQVKARSLIVLLDCCHAGAFGKDRLPTQNQIADALAKQSNMLVLTASKGAQQALELDGPQQEHGLFSLKVIEALGGSADKNADGNITAEELRDYVVRGVAQYSGGEQTPEFLAGAGFDLQTVVARSAKAGGKTKTESKAAEALPILRSRE